MITFMNQFGGNNGRWLSSSSSSTSSSTTSTHHIPSPQSSGRNITTTAASSLNSSNNNTNSTSNSGNGTNSNNYLIKGPIHRAYSSSTTNSANNNATGSNGGFFFSSPNSKKTQPNGKVQTSTSYFASSSITGIGIRKRLYSYNNYYHYYNSNGLPSTSISMLNNNNNNNKPRSLIERYAVSSMIVLAIIWILATIITIGYHGYYYGKPFPGFIPENSTNNNNNNNNNLQQNQQRQQIVLPDPKSEDTSSSSSSSKSNSVLLLHPYETPLVIFTCHRAEYLRRTLQYIYEYLPTSYANNHSQSTFCTIGCPIIISQDGTDSEVIAVIKEYRTKFAAIGRGGTTGIPLYHIQHSVSDDDKNRYNPYQLLAIHYGYALHQIFNGQLKLGIGPDDERFSVLTLPITPQRIIILEEDIQISVDFFDYFAVTAPLLDDDPTLLAISAFNDNGYGNGQVVDPYRIRRSDFFPGLGWMMNAVVWQKELASKWPHGYWDDWIREPKQRQNRHILHPELSRTYHFGSSGGASSNQFGSHLQSIQVNTIPVPWHSYQTIVHNQLRLNTYNTNYIQLIQAAQLVTTVAEAYNLVEQHHQQQGGPYYNYRIEYTSQFHYKQLVHDVQPHALMDDEKAGIYRTAYKGIVETRIVVGNNGGYNLEDHKIIPPNEYTNYQDELIKNHPILFIMPPLSEVIASLSAADNTISSPQ